MKKGRDGSVSLSPDEAETVRVMHSLLIEHAKQTSAGQKMLNDDYDRIRGTKFPGWL